MRGTLTYPRYKGSVSQLSEVWKPVFHFKEAIQSHALAIQNVPNHVVAYHARARTCLVRKQICCCKKKEKSGVSFTWNTSCTSTSWEMCWRPSMSQVSKKPLKQSSYLETQQRNHRYTNKLSIWKPNYQSWSSANRDWKLWYCQGRQMQTWKKILKRRSRRYPD